MTVNRRSFIKAVGATAALVAAPAIVKSASNPRVIVVGGGFAGATAAKYIRMWSGYSIDVTLVDRNASHTSCILSNLVLNRSAQLSDLKLSYDLLAQKYGVEVVTDLVAEIDGNGQRVRLANGGWRNYDRLIVATGIGFEMVPGLDFNINPHAWIAGSQTQLLEEKIRGLGANSTFVMTIPESPYRCPPGPYERACLVADMLLGNGQTSANNPRVIVLDANNDIQAERETFNRAFTTLYGNILEYIPNATLEAIEGGGTVAQTNIGEFHGDVINVIPVQRATDLVRNAGLTGSGRWAPVDPLTYESTESGFQGVHVIGDSQGTNQPKSGHMANSQAKICADAIVRSLYGLPTDTAERIENITTNSACYSPITADQASWLTANFAYNSDLEQMQLTHIGEAEQWNSKNYEQMFDWARNLFHDSFY